MFKSPKIELLSSGKIQRKKREKTKSEQQVSLFSTMAPLSICSSDVYRMVNNGFCVRARTGQIENEDASRKKDGIFKPLCE